MKGSLQHYLNPLHVYCRLRDAGMEKKTALAICKGYEHAKNRIREMCVAVAQICRKRRVKWKYRL